ncbi:MAG: hypothetical protein QXH67_04125 [Candidatus Bathyarchaeia archaeon]
MFGLMKALLEPKPTSPLYGRSPARLYLQPFSEETAGVPKEGVPRVPDPLQGELDKRGHRQTRKGAWMAHPIWEQRRGQKGGLPHERALEETVSEGMKIVRDELEHFLQERDRTTYIAVLKVAATSARWREAKLAIEARRGYSVNDATVRNALENLKAAMLIKEDHGTYRVEDPMLRNLLITSEI